MIFPITGNGYTLYDIECTSFGLGEAETFRLSIELINKTLGQV